MCPVTPSAAGGLVVVVVGGVEIKHDALLRPTRPSVQSKGTDRLLMGGFFSSFLLLLLRTLPPYAARGVYKIFMPPSPPV